MNLFFQIGGLIFGICSILGIIWLIVSHIKTKKALKEYKERLNHNVQLEEYKQLALQKKLSLTIYKGGNIRFSEEHKHHHKHARSRSSSPSFFETSSLKPDLWSWYVQSLLVAGIRAVWMTRKLSDITMSQKDGFL